MAATDSAWIRPEQVFQFTSTEHPVIQALLYESLAGLPWTGDNFILGMIADSQPWLITSPGIREPLGYFAIRDRFQLTALFIRPAYRRYDRQIMEQILAQFNIHFAYIRSWDHHTLPIYLEFLHRCENQAYQFELLPGQAPAPPQPGIRLRLAQAADLEFLEEADFLTNPAGYVRRQELWIARNRESRPVGIGVIQPHQASADHLDIGMYTIPPLLGRGLGRSILSLLMNLVVDSGRVPVAGCFHKNHASRRALEGAGMTCVGTIFRFSFDRDRLKKE